MLSEDFNLSYDNESKSLRFTCDFLFSELDITQGYIFKWQHSDYSPPKYNAHRGLHVYYYSIRTVSFGYSPRDDSCQ